MPSSISDDGEPLRSDQLDVVHTKCKEHGDP